MKKNLILIFLLSSVLLANAQTHKGKVFYYYLLKPSLGYDGSVFAKKHTDKQWVKLFSNNAKGLKKELLYQNIKLKEFLDSEKFIEILPHLKAFALEFASNKKNFPECIE